MSGYINDACLDLLRKAGCNVKHGVYLWRFWADSEVIDLPLTDWLERRRQAAVALKEARLLLDLASNYLTYSNDGELLGKIDDWMARYYRIMEKPGGSYDEQPGAGL